MDAKLDHRNHKQRYFTWKEKQGKRIPKLSPQNSQIILNYIFDMEHGLNIGVGSKKGARSFNRLNNIRQRMVFLVKKFEDTYNLTDITQMNERQIHEFFTNMRNGVIRRVDGKLSYGEGNRAWNTLRLKQNLLQEFPQLKQRRQKFGYKMIMHRNYAELLNELKKMQKKDQAIPIFLFFVEE